MRLAGKHMEIEARNYKSQNQDCSVKIQGREERLREGH